jgi:energy-coupling factor transport system substrate-specific component
MSSVSSSSSVARKSGSAITDDFNTMTWVLIPVAIAINVAIGQIVLLLRLPVYLDSIGTVLVGVLCGPWAGALAGALTNVVWGITIDPGSFPWFPVNAAIGLVAGFAAKAGLFKSWWKVAITGFLIAIAAVLVSTPIGVYLFGGISGSGSSLITAYLLQTGRGLVEAVLSTNFLVEPIDKISTALLAFAIIEGLSKRYLARFPRPENVSLERQGDRRTQLLVALGVVIVLLLITAFWLVNFLN